VAIPTGVIFIWSGTNVSIPAGWERETSLDGKFPKVIADGTTNPNTTGGASTHSHTSSAHTHTMASHTHTVSTSGGTGGGTSTEDGTGASRRDHVHPAVTSGGPTNVSISSVSVTYSAISNNPPYYEVIFIKPSAPAGGLPNEVIGFSDDASFTNNSGKYNGYYHCDGNNSTPNFTNKYLKGAGTGADAGTTGGSTTNVHNIDHSHTQYHDHAPVGIPNHISLGYQRKSGSGPSDTVSSSHTHVTYVSANGDTVTSSGLSLTTAETVEPSHKIIYAIQNRSSSTYTPVGIIGMWLGTLSSIPGNFELLTTYYGYYAKHNTSNLGTTGGSNTHTHASQNHSHSASHTHGASITGHSQNVDNNNSGYTVTTNATVHTPSISTDTMTFDNAGTSADSSSNEPEYRTVAFIKYKGEKGGAFLFNLLR
jgi:hypothetical protein